jgi:hypothetical protein
VIETDASDQGWGFEVTTPNPNIQVKQWSAGGWTTEESILSINYRELKAVLFAIQINARYWKGQTILIRTDNMTTRAFINKQGGTIHHLHEIATLIHTICQSHRIRLFAEYLPGVENTRADFLSRMKVDRDDWQLPPSIFRYLQRQAKIDLDLFATRRTRQTTVFYSRFPDPEAKGTNAFAHPWPKTGAYANPPWILINKVLQKVNTERCNLTLITPFWKQQSWWPELLRMSTAPPTFLPRQRIFRKQTSTLPRTAHWDALAWHISGNPHTPRIWRQQLANSSRQAFDGHPGRTITPHSNTIWLGAIDNISIPCVQPFSNA